VGAAGGPAGQAPRRRIRRGRRRGGCATRRRPTGADRCGRLQGGRARRPRRHPGGGRRGGRGPEGPRRAHRVGGWGGAPVAGRPPPAALELYERKGNVVAAARLNGVSSQSV
jgi:hypothetical protein